MFDIRDYIEKLEIAKESNTQWKCICPICKDNNLAISKTNGAYKCFSNFCDNKEIRNILSPPNSIFVKKKVFIEVKPLIFDIQVKLPYQVATIKSNINYCYKENNKIIYIYDQYHKIERVIDKSGKKVFYPKYFDKEQREWYYGVDQPFKPYKPFDKILSGDTLVIVEGEKCAYTLSLLGIGSLTFRSYKQEDIISNLNYIYKYFNIEKFIYITDNDITGIKKAYIVKDIINKIYRQCTIIEIKELYNIFNLPCNQGDDIYDLLQLQTFDLKEVLDKWIIN